MIQMRKLMLYSVMLLLYLTEAIDRPKAITPRTIGSLIDYKYYLTTTTYESVTYHEDTGFIILAGSSNDPNLLRNE